ncbi:MAG: error-prone DNA polymerase, partial [Actinobacteria bacterium]|nr:error-prone DNA polymerase [Actinomycetota bacterium]
KIVGAVADEIFEKMQAFASYGFPESHSVSFAYLVYASSYIKFHEPTAFYAALLNAQPMGFWSPHSLVQDAQRHGVVVLSPDLNASKATATLEPHDNSAGGFALRLGISSVRGIGDELAKAIEVARPFTSMEDLVRRVPQLSLSQIETLATSGAYSQCFEISRRDALWSAGAVIQSRPERLAGVTTGNDSPQLPGMQPIEKSICDLWSTGISIDGHPTQFVRNQLNQLGVVVASDMAKVENGSKIFVGGVITHRQRPSTSRGVTFFSLEDETGLINVIVSQGCFKRFRHEAINASALLVRGKIESSQGVINIIAEHLSELKIATRGVSSRDFR